VQWNILNNYKSDFLKHIKSSDIPKVRMLWESIPVHLAKEKKKFVYKEIKTGGRAAEFENALDWLVQTGLVHKVSKVNEAKMPLISYENKEHFKLFMLDIGLLGAMANLDISAFFSAEQEVFSEFKGALAEQFALQELKTLKRMPIYYWASESGKAEVDFVLQMKNSIIPLEIKSSAHVKSKSLAVYMQKYKPECAIRASLKNYGKDENLLSLPLYLMREHFMHQNTTKSFL
jgi:predicted AAA+ superfamily ATPase